jgi:hypothetical protein
MNRTSPLHVLLLAATLGLSALGCEGGGVGDPCVPEDEYRQDFNGYAMAEVNVESKSFQCETRVCIVNHFQGRVSCPYGQGGPPGSTLVPDIISRTVGGDDDDNTAPNPEYQPPEDPARCRIPGTDGNHCVNTDTNAVVPCNSPGATNVDEITVPVDSQRIYRNAQDTVYCSCRCKGPDPSAKYCECPSGYECSELVRELGLPGKAQLAGSYCVKAGTVYNPQVAIDEATCYREGKAAGGAKQAKTADGRFDIGEVCGTPLLENP